MSAHDYPIRKVKVSQLNSTHVLVGESGGLSAVYDVNESNIVFGCLLVETEHGPLYLDPDEETIVYDEEGD